MNDKERFLATMRYQTVDRVPFWEFGSWPETYDRWKSEGFDPDNPDPRTITDKRAWVGNWFFPSPPFEHEVISEDDHTITYINHEGIFTPVL